MSTKRFYPDQHRPWKPGQLVVNPYREQFSYNARMKFTLMMLDMRLIHIRRLAADNPRY